MRADKANNQEWHRKNISMLFRKKDVKPIGCKAEEYDRAKKCIEGCQNIHQADTAKRFIYLWQFKWCDYELFSYLEELYWAKYRILQLEELK